jgi:hypothetical protein
MKRPAKCKPVADYWYQFYCTNHCTLCGNSGVIDTRGATTAAGIRVGRLNWCICPNGQAFRNQSKGAEPTRVTYWQ